VSLNPLPSEFLARLHALEASYLDEVDPIRQSGFSGGAERWRAEREPLLEPVRDSGEILDIGCANGFLLESLLGLAGERGITLTPFGLDHSARLVQLARERLPRYADHFYVGNAWEWQPPRQYRYVYSVHGCVPEHLVGPYAKRLLEIVVAPGGLLILGAYGSRSRGICPLDLKERLTEGGLKIAGKTTVGEPTISRFVWLAA
jgi:SAM-dependent methyltransferase